MVHENSYQATSHDPDGHNIVIFRSARLKLISRFLLFPSTDSVILQIHKSKWEGANSYPSSLWDGLQLDLFLMFGLSFYDIVQRTRGCKELVKEVTIEKRKKEKGGEANVQKGRGEEGMEHSKRKDGLL